ncbi:MAG: PAS domain-containing protein [Syntrophomonadaceae bacterium]|nr:PAS domain-containing protein [Syntrophomonadaceae bacterium]
MSLGLELHSKEPLLYPILQDMNEGIILADASHNMIFYNESAEKILATPLDKFLGQNVYEISAEFAFSSILKSQQFLPTHKLINGEEINITKGLIEVSPDNYFIYFILSPVNTFNDIHLQTLLNNPYEGIAIFDQNYRLIYANELCYSSFGCDNEEQLADEFITSLIPLTLFSESINKARPIYEAITIKSRTIGLIYLPIIRHNHLAGIIVKSSLFPQQERNWGDLVEEYNSGATYNLDYIVGQSEFIKQQREFAQKAL